jgi:transcriptional regulator with PAS, ATPase and Fis domain
MKTLLTFIGSNDAGKLLDKEDGAILTVINERKFDDFYLLYNASGVAENNGKKVAYKDVASYIKQEIVSNNNTKAANIHIKEADIGNIIDHVSVYQYLVQFLNNEFTESDRKKMDFTAAISSGTPAMQTAWILIAETGSFPLKLVRSVERRYAKGKKRVFDVPKMTGTIEKIERLKAFETTIKPLKARNPFEIVDSMNLSEEVKYLAHSKKQVIIIGDTGVGKEVLAETLIKQSGLEIEKYIAINCAGLSNELLESELFGHEKGAFTGANKKKDGLVKEYSDGAIFLDEVNSMPLPVQAKLLRFLESKEYRPVGSNKTEKSNVWIIAAGNKSIRMLVNEGKFREDLFYRLNTFELYIPPLRKRKELIPNLITRLSGLSFSDECLAMLMDHDYKGNIRELKIILERIAVLNKGETKITNPDIVRTVIDELNPKYEYSDIVIPQELYGKAYDLMKQILSNAALSQSKNAQEASKLLGLSHGSVVKKYAGGKKR